MGYVDLKLVAKRSTTSLNWGNEVTLTIQRELVKGITKLLLLVFLKSHVYDIIVSNPTKKEETLHAFMLRIASLFCMQGETKEPYWLPKALFYRIKTVRFFLPVP